MNKVVELNPKHNKRKLNLVNFYMKEYKNESHY